MRWQVFHFVYIFVWKLDEVTSCAFPIVDELIVLEFDAVLMFEYAFAQSAGRDSGSILRFQKQIANSNF